MCQFTILLLNDTFKNFYHWVYHFKLISVLDSSNLFGLNSLCVCESVCMLHNMGGFYIVRDTGQGKESSWKRKWTFIGRK